MVGDSGATSVNDSVVGEAVDLSNCSHARNTVQDCWVKHVGAVHDEFAAVEALLKFNVGGPNVAVPVHLQGFTVPFTNQFHRRLSSL